MKPKPKEKASSRIEQFGLIDWRWLLWNGRRLAGAHEELLAAVEGRPPCLACINVHVVVCEMG